MEIKGTWITDYARIIRANKDKNWDKYLTPDDWKIINAKILSSVWYPYESFMRMGTAVFHEIAQGNLEVARGFGKMLLENLAAIYKNLIIPGDPVTSIGKIYALQRSFFRDVPSVIAPVLHEKNRTVVRIGITEIEKRMGEPEAFAYQFMGLMEKLIEKVGVNKYQAEVRAVEDGYEVDLRWE